MVEMIGSIPTLFAQRLNMFLPNPSSQEEIIFHSNYEATERLVPFNFDVGFSNNDGKRRLFFAHSIMFLEIDGRLNP